ncbi:MAG: molybdate ABC transporter substrate-binding protein [Acidocella sp.]|uniref:molybdate ABC transporter substrate-binding protein n=1 Tax=Acidocella sp. TaxID=50710 RepID=UPI003FBE5A47
MSTAPANSIPPGVTVFCDPTLAPALRAFAPIARAQLGAPVAVLSAVAAGMLAQIQRHTRNDVLFTLSTAMDQAVQARFVVLSTRTNGFANALVLAGLAGRFPAPANAAALAQLVAGSKIAVTDDTVASALDGRAVLASNGLASGNVMGTANTGDAAFLVTTHVVDIALIYRTDALADPRLTVLATLTADPTLTTYSVAVNAKAVSPNARALVGLISSSGGAALLRQAGLEAVT